MVGLSCVQVTRAQDVQISDSSFTNCTGLVAGAVLLQGDANITIKDTTWTGNRGTGSKSEGGAGALGISFVDRVRLLNSVFTSNTAARAAGGAISCNMCGQQEYEQVAFRRNTALRGTGGGLYQNSSTSTTLLKDVVFEANQASSHGGGLCSYSVHPPSCVDSITNCRTWLNGCTLVGNKAGVGPYSFGGGGGGMYMEQKAAMWRALIVTNSSFVNNTAASQELSTIQSIDVDASGAGGAIGQSGQQVGWVAGVHVCGVGGAGLHRPGSLLSQHQKRYLGGLLQLPPGHGAWDVCSSAWWLHMPLLTTLLQSVSICAAAYSSLAWQRSTPDQLCTSLLALLPSYHPEHQQLHLQHHL
jgi:predicted outer membrane repeat protein